MKQTQPTLQDKILAWTGKKQRFLFARTLDQSRALSAFEAMGTNAATALPDLVAMANHEETCRVAINAMARIGLPADGPFKALLDRSPEDVLRVLYSIESGEEPLFQRFTQIYEQQLTVWSNRMSPAMRTHQNQHDTLFDPLKGPEGELWH